MDQEIKAACEAVGCVVGAVVAWAMAHQPVFATVSSIMSIALGLLAVPFYVKRLLRD